MSSSLENITLIIPTYNRPEYLARLLNYYASQNTGMRFLILDSSEDKLKIENEKLFPILGQQVQAISFPSSISVAEKLFAGLKEVKTPFCAFCADDDLVFINGLMQALAFLQKNSDYVCADGIYLNFNLCARDIKLHVEYATKGIQENESGARVFKLYQKYESLFYGVFSTEHALNIFSGVSKIPTLHYQELFQSTSALLIGKSQRLPIFYAARQSCNPADPSRDKWQTYYWFAENPQEFLMHYLQYRDGLWLFYQEHISEKKYTQDEFIKLMDIAHATYFGIGCPPEYFHSTFQEKWPNDKYKKSHIFWDNVCNQLKSRPRARLEAWIMEFARLLPKALPSLYSISALRSLNREAYDKTDIEWKCHLTRELRWLVTVEDFRDSYHELCKYASIS